MLSPRQISVLGLVLLVTATATSAQGLNSAGKTVSPAIKSAQMMTRDELRDCMAQRRSLDTRSKASAQATVKLQAEKDRLAAAGVTLEEQRADLAKQRDEFNRANNAVRDNAKKLHAWNQELHRIAAAPASASPEHKKQLETDYASLHSQNQTQITQTAQLYKKYSEEIKQFNSDATALSKDIAAWNTQDKQFTAEANALTKLHTDYASACTNRPFLEADSDAIKAGK